MRGFLLLWLVAAATAAKLGYNYQPAGYNAAIGASHGAAAATTTAFNVQHNRFAGHIDAPATTYSVQPQPQQQQQQPEQQLVADEFSKEFYTYAAPEEDFNDQEANQRIAGMLKRNLRVVFIKAPEHQGLTNAAVQLAKQASEQRTAIYVLTKQADVGELAQRLQNAGQGQTQKPSVHFVKYRTPEDAQRAQQVIQQQFDALGGTTRNAEGAVAPVLDFSSPAAAAAPVTATVAEPHSAYLPAAVTTLKRHR